MSKIGDLLDKAKEAIAEGESSLRKAAELVADAQEAGATQKQITERLGKSRSWVTFLLAWRKDGYRGGAFDKSHKARVSSRARPEKTKPESATTGEKARAERARAHAETVKAEAAKAKAEAAKAKAEAARAKAEATAQRARWRTAQEQTRRTAYGGFRGAPSKEIHSSVRTLLVKVLGMLGSNSDNEALVAARKAEEFRKRTGMSWDDLIITATPAAREAA